MQALEVIRSKARRVSAIPPTCDRSNRSPQNQTPKTMGTAIEVRNAVNTAPTATKSRTRVIRESELINTIPVTIPVQIAASENTNCPLNIRKALRVAPTTR